DGVAAVAAHGPRVVGRNGGDAFEGDVVSEERDRPTRSVAVLDERRSHRPRIVRPRAGHAEQLSSCGRVGYGLPCVRRRGTDGDGGHCHRKSRNEEEREPDHPWAYHARHLLKPARSGAVFLAPARKTVPRSVLELTDRGNDAYGEGNRQDALMAER